MTHGWLLALETSSLRGSVALGREGALEAVRELPAERRNASDLLPAISDLTRSCGIGLREVEVCVFSRGPGSFTGLRLAATIVRMLRSVAGCEVVGVSTLAGIAHAVASSEMEADQIVVMLEAKRGQVYGAAYGRNRKDVGRVICEPGVYEPASWLESIDGAFVATGTGVAKYRSVIAERGGELADEALWWPRAEHIFALGAEAARLGRFSNVSEITPLYLRPPECEEVYEARRSAARERRGE